MSCSCLSSPNEVYKKSGEILNVSMDFNEALGEDVTISTVDFLSTPAGIIYTNQIVAGQIVHFTIAGGISGTNYIVSLTITTSDNQTLVGEGPLKVRDR